jgi:hypothetical protein
VATVGALLYGCGFFAIQYTALRRGLGLLNPPQAQCFMAGVVPTLLFLGFWLAVAGSGSLASALHARAVTGVGGKAPWRRGGAILWVVFCTSFVAALCWHFSVFQLSASGGVADGGSSSHGVPAWMVITLVGLYYVSYTLLAALLPPNHALLGPRREGERSESSPLAPQPGGANLVEWVGKLMRPLLVAIVPFIMLYALLLAYGDVFVPRWYQEFGGMAPRAAHIDLSRDQLSAETRAALLPPAAQGASAEASENQPPVVRTVLLDVEFDAGDYLLVRPRGAAGDVLVYRIQKDSVRGVTWYGYDGDLPRYIEAREAREAAR